MKGWKVAFVMWLWTLAMIGVIKYHDTVNQAKIDYLHRSLNKTYLQLERVQEKVYENETWLAELQADSWNTHQNLESMIYRWR